jgi:hypothetical protein
LAQGCLRRVFCSVILGGVKRIEDKVILRRLVDHELGLPLLGCAVDEIKDMHEILGINSDALITLGISLI